MRESKKSEGGAFKAPPPPPDRIGLKLFSIATYFVNFKHNFSKEIKFFPKKIKTIQREKLEDASVFVRIAISYP